MGIWIKLRTRWFLSRKGELPPDVREYIFRHHLKGAIAELKTKEEKDALITSLVVTALAVEKDPLSLETSAELLGAAFELRDGAAPVLPKPESGGPEFKRGAP